MITTKPAAAFYLPFTRFWELAAGGLLAFGKLHPRPSLPAAWSAPLRQCAAGLGLLLLITSAAFLHESNRFPGWQAALPVAGAVLLIAAGPSAWLNRHLLSARWLVAIGLISYPLHLWHWPLLAFTRIAEGQTPDAIVRGTLVLVSVALAWATYRFVESPIRHRAVRVINARRLALTMALLALFGGMTNYARGFTFRYPDAIRAIATYDYNGKKEARTGRCFLKSEQDQTAFTEECRDNAHADKPVVFLWGDSHAAHLYPGLRHLQQQEQNFRLMQYNASGCPPVLDVEIPKRDHCKSINDFTYAQLQALKPDAVLLAGFWDAYTGGELGRLSPEQIKRTINAVKASGVRHIVLMGQVPTWQEPQPKVILKLWEQQSRIPDRTHYLLNPSYQNSDDRMRRIARETGITFVSPIDTFCTSAGCLTFANAQHTAPVAHDYGHLTDVGSTLLIRSAKDSILPPDLMPSHRGR